MILFLITYTNVCEMQNAIKCKFTCHLTCHDLYKTKNTLPSENSEMLAIGLLAHDISRSCICGYMTYVSRLCFLFCLLADELNQSEMPRAQVDLQEHCTIFSK